MYAHTYIHALPSYRQIFANFSNVHSVTVNIIKILEIYICFSVQQGSSVKEHIALKIMRQKTVKKIDSVIEGRLTVNLQSSNLSLEAPC